MKIIRGILFSKIHIVGCVVVWNEFNYFFLSLSLFIYLFVCLQLKKIIYMSTFVGGNNNFIFLRHNLTIDGNIFVVVVLVVSNSREKKKRELNLHSLMKQQRSKAATRDSFLFFFPFFLFQLCVSNLHNLMSFNLSHVDIYFIFLLRIHLYFEIIWFDFFFYFVSQFILL